MGGQGESSGLKIMSRYILDIEGDNLLRRVTKMWILAIKDIDTGKKTYWLEGDLGWQEVLNNATLLVGHNVLGYDFPTLEKLFGYKLPNKVKVHDTLVMSQILNYARFPGNRHSLEVWGESLGVPKGDFHDFSKYTPEMLEYCLQDLEVTLAVYRKLLKELEGVKAKSPNITTYIRAEHAVSKWCAQAELHGWPFNFKIAQELFAQMAAEKQKAYDAISPILGLKVIPVDKKGGVVESKSPKWTKQGFYNSHTANWFNIDPCSGFEGEERMVEGEFCRVTFEPLSLDSSNDVKTFLFRHGWEPTEYNWKMDPETREQIRMSPKITEDSLEAMQGNGKLYVDFLSTSSRYSILKTWLEETDENGNLHGECFTIGTPSMRARHSIIVNVPSVDAAWGPEMRELFGCKPGWKFIGADSAGNQARGLAHYLKSPEYIDLLLNGDIHQFNADVATKVLREMGLSHTVPRSVAKRILYAFLFGASGGKLWSYIFGTQDKKKGNRFKKAFTKAVPGFQELLKKLENIYGSTQQFGMGYIPGIAGNRIYVDSFHKLLVYLLQACEKATCAAAVMLTMDGLERESIPYQPLIFYHDEIDFMVPEEFADRAAIIAKEAFKEGPKLFGITIMDGEAKIGYNWKECH